MPTIESIRLSFVWVDTIPGLLDELAPGAALAWLGRRGDYIYEFDRAQSFSIAPPGIRTPWQGRDSGWSFWRYYFEATKPSSVTGNQAWKNLAPFREDLVQFAPDGEAFSELRVSSFYFSHGSALVLTLNLRHQALTVLEAAKRMMALRHDAVLKLPGDAQRHTLNVLGNAIRARIHETGFAGLQTHAGRNQPFSVVTVLQADGVDRLAVVAEGDDTHRALEAMTGWNPNFDALDLAQYPIADSKIARSGKLGLDNDLVYARKYGVAIWLPRHLSDTKKGGKPLSCYHNNMLHGSLQIRSLAELVAFANRGAGVSLAVDQRVQRAETKLDMMKTGKEHTYRSRCLARQVEHVLAA